MAKKKIRYYKRAARHTSSSDKDAVQTQFLGYVLERNGQVKVTVLFSRDKYPNIDGIFEMASPIGDPENWILAQVKPINSGKKVISHTFDNDLFIEYCKQEHGMPVFFIGVDLDNEVAYWCEVPPEYAMSLKGLTIQIPKENIIRLGETKYIDEWRKICDERNKIFEQAKADAARGKQSLVIDEATSSKSAIAQLFISKQDSELLNKNISVVDSIVKNIKEKIFLYEGYLFLASPAYMNNEDIRKIIRDSIGITKKQEELFIEELISKGILSTTGEIVVFVEDALGQEKLAYLLENNLLEVEEIYKKLTDTKVRASILKKIANISHLPQIDDFLLLLATDLNKSLDKLNNDEITANLDLLNEYSFRVPKETIKIVNKILSTETKQAKIHKTKFGVVQGVSHRTLLLKIIDVLRTIRYLEVKDVSTIATEIINSSSDDSVKKKTLGLVKEMSEYNLYALRQIGYYPQNQLLEIVESWSQENLSQNEIVLFEIARELLTSEFEGSKMTDYKTLTMIFGPLESSDELRLIRQRIAKVLIKYFNHAKNLKAKKQILNILEVGSRTPPRGKYSEDLEQLITNYVNNILMPFYLKQPINDLILIHTIEGQLHWFIKRYGEKIKQASKLRTKLNEAELYRTFKLFYGYDYDFDIDTPWKEASEKRESLIKKTVDEITEESISDWKKKLLSIADAYEEEEPGKLMYFSKFLEDFSKRKPSLAITIINEPKLKPFLTSLLAGLWESELNEKLIKIIFEWIEQKKNLESIANLFWFRRASDFPIMEKLFEQAKKAQDVIALTALVRGIAFSYKEEKGVKKLFFKAIRELTKLDSTRWLYNFYPQDRGLLDSLTDSEVKILLKNLILVEDINHNAEEVLIPISEQFPEKVVELFYKRIKSQVKKKRNERYDAVPFSFYELQKTLAANPNVVLDEVFKWFKSEDWLYHFDAPNFLQQIFPGMNKPLKQKLISLIGEGGESNANTVLSILRAYKGESHLHGVVKAFVKKYLRSEKSKQYNEYRSELFIALSTTGVVSGEYGLPNAYKQKKEAIQSWKKDKSKTIQRFVKEYEDYLDKEIAYHTKRADEDIELMKRGAR